MKSKKKKGEGLGSPVNIVFPKNMSADEMKQIIADGLMEFEKRKECQEEADKELRQKEWQQTIGAKDFFNVKRPKRWLLELCNAVNVLWKVSRITEKDVRGDGAAFGLMQMLLELVFGMLNVGSLLVALVLFLTSPVICFREGISFLSVETVAVSWAFGLFALFLSRVFRIVSFEIMNIKDRNYLLGLFTCVTSVISIVIAFVALLVAWR